MIFHCFLSFRICVSTARKESGGSCQIIGRLQGRSLPRYLHGVTVGWCALCGTSPRQRYLHPCLLIQLSRCSYSSANHPGGLLPVWEFTLRDCCAIMATIRIYIFCCRYPNVSNLRVQFVWRMDIIDFQNSYCRIGGAKK